jgi:hypothetical protein
MIESIASFVYYLYHFLESVSEIEMILHKKSSNAMRWLNCESLLTSTPCSLLSTLHKKQEAATRDALFVSIT